MFWKIVFSIFLVILINFSAKAQEKEFSFYGGTGLDYNKRNLFIGMYDYSYKYSPSFNSAYNISLAGGFRIKNFDLNFTMSRYMLNLQLNGTASNESYSPGPGGSYYVQKHIYGVVYHNKLRGLEYYLEGGRDTKLIKKTNFKLSIIPSAGLGYLQMQRQEVLQDEKSVTSSGYAHSQDTSITYNPASYVYSMKDGVVFDNYGVFVFVNIKVGFKFFNHEIQLIAGVKRYPEDIIFHWDNSFYLQNVPYAGVRYLYFFKPVTIKQKTNKKDP